MDAILGSERTEISVAMIKILIVMVIGSMAKSPWIDEDKTVSKMSVIVRVLTDSMAQVLRLMQRSGGNRILRT